MTNHLGMLLFISYLYFNYRYLNVQLEVENVTNQKGDQYAEQITKHIQLVVI